MKNYKELKSKKIEIESTGWPIFKMVNLAPWKISG